MFKIGDMVISTKGRHGSIQYPGKVVEIGKKWRHYRAVIVEKHNGKRQLYLSKNLELVDMRKESWNFELIGVIIGLLTFCALVVTTIIALWPTESKALTKKQIETISFVKHEASKYTRYPSAMAAICLTESSAGVNRVGDEKKSLGLMQIQVDAVRFVARVDKSMRWTNKLRRYDLEKILLWNDRFSVEVACKYFEHYRKHGGFEYALGMYNGGGLSNRTYIDKVKENMEITRMIK